MTDLPELTEAEAAMLRYIAAPGSANPHELEQRGLLSPQYRDGVFVPRELTGLGRAALEAYDAARDKRIVQDAHVAHDSRVGAELAAQLVAARDELHTLRGSLRDALVPLRDAVNFLRDCHRDPDAGLLREARLRVVEEACKLVLRSALREQADA